MSRKKIDITLLSAMDGENLSRAVRFLKVL